MNDRTIPGTSIRLSLGDRSDAEPALREAVKLRPNDAEACSRLGHFLAQADRLREAEPYWRRAAELGPDSAPHRYNLAELLRRLGHATEAEREFRAAIALKPDWPEAVFGLANVLKDQGHVAAALARYEEALALQPRFVRALYNRANLLREEGRTAAAAEQYQRLLELDPGFVDARTNRAAALSDLRQWGEAEAEYREALKHRPGDHELTDALAGAVLAQGRTAEGVEIQRSFGERSDFPATARFRWQTVLPLVAESAAAAADERARFFAVLEGARRFPPRLRLPRIHERGWEPPMTLAYQAEATRPVLEAYAALYRDQIPPLDLLEPAGGRPRVGVVVTNGHEGVYDRCLGRTIGRIAGGGRVDVTLVCSRAGANVLRQLRPSFAGRYLCLPTRVDEAAARIRDARFDLLHYWEVGTDATNYFLPYFRPARVQCATWGWPVTTGNPRVDWYVSAAPLEPVDADEHYTERLARLPSLPTYSERPPVPGTRVGPAARRKAFGVDGRTPVYLCVQNIRKMHPDFDRLLAGILQQDPRGRVVLLADDQPALTSTLLNRLRPVLGSHISRLGVVPRQDRGGYLKMVAAADVLLDTPHYGGGANTMADAAACGTPVVTLLGRYHRSRWAGAVLRQARAQELVTESEAAYVAAAVRSANDERHRRALGQALMDFGDEWFGDRKAAAELEAFWLERIAND